MSSWCHATAEGTTRLGFAGYGPNLLLEPFALKHGLMIAWDQVIDKSFAIQILWILCNSIVLEQFSWTLIKDLLLGNERFNFVILWEKLYKFSSQARSGEHVWVSYLIRLSPSRDISPSCRIYEHQSYRRGN